MCKKILAICLSIIFVFGLVACSKENDASLNTDNVSVSQKDSTTQSNNQLTTESETNEESTVSTTANTTVTTNKSSESKPSNTKNETANEYDVYRQSVQDRRSRCGQGNRRFPELAGHVWR